MHPVSCPLGSRAFRTLHLLVVTAFIAMGCGGEDGRPFGNLKIMTGPDGGPAPADSGSGGEGALGVTGKGGPVVVPGGEGDKGGAAVPEGTGGASGGTATGGVAGLGSGGAGLVPGTGGARPAGSGGAASGGGSGGVSGSGGGAATAGSGGGQAPRGSGGTTAGGGGVKGTGGAPASSGGTLGSGGHPASSGGGPGSGGNIPPASTGGTTPPAGSGGAEGSGTGGKSGGGTGGTPGAEDCGQLIKDYDAALTDAKACKAGDKAGDMKGCKNAVPAKLAGCGSECTTYVEKSDALDALRKRWDKAGCSAAACLISLCVVSNPTSGTCDSSGTCTDNSIFGL